MKKKKIIVFLYLCLFFIFSQKVNALEFTNGIYINDNGIEMTEEQVKNLKSLSFSEKEISLMDEDEFINNKNLSGVTVATIDKFYKTTIYYNYNDNITSAINNSDINSISVTEEISEDEYAEASNETIISTMGLTNGYTETNYKKMTTTIIYVNSSYYRYRNDLVWKTMPSTRSYDIIGIGIDSTVSGVDSSKYLKTTIDYEDSSSLTCYTSTSTSVTGWELSGSGYAATFKLPSNTSTKTVTGLSTYMYFNVQKLSSGTIKTLNAYGSYKHAQKSVSSSVSTGVSIGTSGISFDATVTTTIVSSYDSMSTAQATYSGLSW